MIGAAKAGARLRDWRAEVGITQHALATCLYAAPGTVSRWERGRAVPGIGFAVRLAKLSQGTVSMETWVEAWCERNGYAHDEEPDPPLPANVVPIDIARRRAEQRPTE